MAAPSTPTYRMRARAEAVEATRGRLLRAAGDAFSKQAYDDVRLGAIAREAGVTQQTLFNHFGSKEALYSACVEAAHERIEDVRTGAVPGDARSVVSALLDQYERGGDANARAAALEERIPAVTAMLALARSYHQDWLAEMFADALPAGGAARRETLAALHAATDVFTWKLLRRDLGLSRRATTDVMSRLVTGLLVTPDDREEDDR